MFQANFSGHNKICGTQ